MPSTRWGCAWKSAGCCHFSSLGSSGPPCMITDWGRSSIPCSRQTSIRCLGRWPCEPLRSMPSQHPGSIRIRRHSRCMEPTRRCPVQAPKASKRRPHRSPLVLPIPTVSLLLTLIASRNLLLLQSLPDSIPYLSTNVRRRKDEYCVGAAARGLGERLSRLPRRVPPDVGPTLRVRGALPTRARDRDRRAQRAPLPPRAAVALARQKC